MYTIAGSRRGAAPVYLARQHAAPRGEPVSTSAAIANLKRSADAMLDEQESCRLKELRFAETERALTANVQQLNAQLDALHVVNAKLYAERLAGAPPPPPPCLRGGYVRQRASRRAYQQLCRAQTTRCATALSSRS